MAEPTLHRAVRGFEALLRQYYRVQEFTNQPGCILRIAVGRADRNVTLSDGTAIRYGDPVIDLHWWNERLPRIPAHGPDIAWAIAMNRQIGGSLAALIDYVGTQPTLRDIGAFRASPAFGTRIGAPQAARFAQRFGFELIEREGEAELSKRALSLADSMLLWSLIRVFNPGGLRNKRLLRDRYEIWASRQYLAALSTAPRPRSEPGS